MINSQIILLAFGTFIFGAGICFLLMKLRLKSAEKTASDLIREAKKNIERERNQIILKAKEEWLRSRDAQEVELKKRAEKLDEFEAMTLELEKNINKREEHLKQKENQLAQRENDLKAQRDAHKVKDSELMRIIHSQNEELSKISGLSLEDAKQKLLQNLKKEYRQEAAEIYKKLVDESKNNASREAKKIITYAVEKLASEYASENTLAVVALPSEEVKGRIIGRDGRNIKSFETASGVKLIVDDTPEAVVISCFDPVQREIARLALEKLVADGKIHPHRIEESLKQSEQEVEKTIWRVGNEMVASIGVGKI
ncbi:MAG: Rnase Y domain-containing protein, partial [bacterium]